MKLKTSETTFDGGKPRTRLIYLERPVHKVVTLLETEMQSETDSNVDTH